MKTTILSASLILALIVTAAPSIAAQPKDYLGFRVGIQKIDETRKQLSEAGAVFEEGFGYKGYSEDLPAIKVESYERFNRYGQVSEAWLHFTPDKRLYTLSVTWFDEGGTFKTLKDALDTKYGNPKTEGFGFQSSYRYHDGKVRIVLERNTFGFGEDQRTSLTFLHEPDTKKVDAKKEAIEQHIRAQNARKAGGDF